MLHSVSPEDGRPPALENAQVGDWAVRYTYEGSHENDKYIIKVLIGNLATREFKYSEEHEAYVAPIATATAVRFDSGYSTGIPGISSTLDLNSLMRNNTSFAYDDHMLLTGLVSTKQEIEASAAHVASPKELEASDLIWQASVIGISAMRAMQRALYTYTNMPEFDMPMLGENPLTDVEIRTSNIGYVGSYALAAFLVEPPQPNYST